ncbi:hypothetical protein [Demequina lignilytica]|uniref:Uncharacterized protein n=1 Tax=Demequina lignilytica TaxID=3051663 RepID=A0AB35MLH7_9MICO|nr:hypothetical protein [Demequina sp. SYSU T0a273]MDN4484503.1 hypothetical protein [Demequina sp. SYSU T0a273]
MKRIIATGFVTALAMVGFAGAASAAPADAACFGQVHKAVNSGFLADAGIHNVGDLVKAVGGQGKNAAAMGICS